MCKDTIGCTFDVFLFLYEKLKVLPMKCARNIYSLKINV